MVLIDSYSESNQISDTSSVVGQSFTGNGSVLNNVQFYLKKSGSPTGNIVAKIYTHSGTFGTSSVPTGSALAVSDNVASSSLGTTFALTSFTFSGANKITLTNGTKYVVTFEHSLSFPDYVLLGQDTTSSTHAGNKSFFSGGSWSAEAADDLCFYVYGDDATTTSTSSSTSTSTTTTLTSSSTSTTSTSTSTSTTSTSSSTSTTTTLPFSRSNYGIKVLKSKTSIPPQIRDKFLNSENVLLKIHKQGAFKARYVQFEGFTVTIQFNELKRRPLILVYCQRINHDNPSILDTNYHLLDWEYNGATKLGYQRVKVYNNKFVLEYLDQIVDDNIGSIIDCFGYYYVFEEEVRE